MDIGAMSNSIAAPYRDLGDSVCRHGVARRHEWALTFERIRPRPRPGQGAARPSRGQIV